ncbi:MAG: cytochrome c biogenesis protein ResB [Bdellovibrionales bacterium]|nr:cytochrome c biogenesis protein ResB [Bdellovibrionales bacterium]
MSFLIKIGKRLSRPDIFFYCGIWMMFLLIVGTISQKYMGLYQAQLNFFSSFIFWFYGIPLPAGRATMGLILISLILKSIFEKKYLKNSGTFIVHIGVILLLTGAFITGLLSKEGYMVIPEKNKSNIISDYHTVELAILSADSEEVISIFPEKKLSKNKVLKKNLSFSLYIKDFIKNVQPVKRATPLGESFKGFSKIFELREKKPEKVNEENLAGLTFQIKRNNKIENYAVFEQMPIPQTIKWDHKKYIVSLGPVKTYLPFYLELTDFKKTYYPGTDKVKSYQSVVNIVEEQVKQRRVIKMNQPLRYKGYTFYQSSFIEEDNLESSVLAVVKNLGRAFPYISSLIICIGLLIHIFYSRHGISIHIKKGKKIKDEAK